MSETDWARLLFVGFFFVLLVPVFLLPRDYVYLGAPDRRVWRDLRLWTLVLVLLHAGLYWFLS